MDRIQRRQALVLLKHSGKPTRKSCHSESLVYVVSTATPKPDSLTVWACCDIIHVGSTLSIFSLNKKRIQTQTEHQGYLSQHVLSVCGVKPVMGYNVLPTCSLFMLRAEQLRVASRAHSCHSLLLLLKTYGHPCGFFCERK